MILDVLKNCPVPHLQNEWEFNMLFTKFFLHEDPHVVLEIGSFYGATLWAWLSFVKPQKRKVISVDLPIGPGDWRYNEMIESRKKWSSWKQPSTELYDIQGDSTDPEIIQKVKDIVANGGDEQYPMDKIDFLFIDGDHTYDGVKKDFNNYYPLVADGGYIVFHDAVGYAGVRSLCNELRQIHKMIDIYNPDGGWGYTIIQK